jgi:pimeloyl-ACP methyl ester carboxylesterase
MGGFAQIKGQPYNRDMSVGTNTASSSCVTQPLSWRWFEFRRPPIPARAGMPVDPDAVYAVEVDAHPVAFKFFRQSGGVNQSRPVAMLLHGLGLSIASFRGIAPYLLATHDLVCPDYSGFSQDNAPLPDHASLKNFARGVWRIADALGIERLSLVGSSLGGGLALMAALLAPERVERIILSNPACFPQKLPSTYRLARIPILGELLMLCSSAEKLGGGVEYIGYVDRIRLDPVLRGMYTANFATWRNRLRLMQLIRQLPAGVNDMTSAAHLPRLSTLRHPILLSWGRQDLLLEEGSGDRLAAELSQVTYDVYPDLAHLPHEEAPDILGPRWAQFLNAPSTPALGR